MNENFWCNNKKLHDSCVGCSDLFIKQTRYIVYSIIQDKKEEKE